MASSIYLIAIFGFVVCFSSIKAELFDKEHDPWRNDKFVVPPPDPKAAAAFLERVKKFGLPSTDNLKLSENYVLSYDRKLRHPIWVMEHLTDELMKLREGNRNASFFTEDTTIHEYFRATNDDYMMTEYDRGHMSPANNNKINQRIMDQSFLLSNMAPQLPGLNRGVWVRLESYCVWLARRSKNIWIVTGALYLPHETKEGLEVEYKVIGENHVAVPTHFYKVFVREDQGGDLSMEAFLLPNSKDVDDYSKLAQFMVNIMDLPTIEKAAGLIFFDKLDRSRIAKPEKFQAKFIDKRIVFRNNSNTNKSSGSSSS